jgi:hypothetical protein
MKTRSPLETEAAGTRAGVSSPPLLLRQAPPESLSAIVAGVRRLAMQRDVLSMAAVAAESLAEIIQGLRATCYLYHAEEGLLWNQDGVEFSATVGITGLAARSGSPCVAERAERDANYHREIDDPDGVGTERLLAQPLVTSTGEIHAVVVVARSSALPEYSDADLALVNLWAEQAAPLFHLLHLERFLDSVANPDVAGRRAIYRQEALDLLAAGEEELAVLRDPLPWWVRHSNLLAIAALLVGGLFCTLVRVKEYASQPALLVDGAARDLEPDGVIRSLLAERSDLAGARRAARPMVLIVVPSRYRWAIAIGQPVVFEPEGSSGVGQRFRVVSVSASADSAEEARRLAGARADTWLLAEPTVIVKARPDGLLGDGVGPAVAVPSGVVGRARLPLGRKRLLYLVFPRLETVWADA